MIEIKNLFKNIDDNNILKGISFNLDNGKILGLIGPNGAGKSTLIKCLAGIYIKDSGEILYDGQPVFDNNIVKEVLGYVPEENDYFAYRKIKDIVKFYKLSYKNFDEKLFENICETLKVDIKKKTYQLSKGMKMKLSIALALSIRPKYLILDEPTSGLDPYFKRVFLDLLVDRVCDDDLSIIISSHNLQEIERICDDIVFLENGTIKYYDTLENLKTKVKKLQVAFKDDLTEEDLKKLNFKNYKKIGRVYTVIEENCDEEFMSMINSKEPILLEEIDLSLEDIFLNAVDYKVVK